RSAATEEPATCTMRTFDRDASFGTPGTKDREGSDRQILTDAVRAGQVFPGRLATGECAGESEGVKLGSPFFIGSRICRVRSPKWCIRTAAHTKPPCQTRPRAHGDSTLGLVRPPGQGK